MFRLLATICLVALASSPAWAACKGKDIKGLYLAYASGTENGIPYAAVCGLKISSSGRIDSGSSCVSDVVNPVRGGTLQVARDCTVSGVIETGDGDIEIPLASMNSHKNSITGVYLVRDGEGSFNAVKHKKVKSASPSLDRYFGE